MTTPQPLAGLSAVDLCRGCQQETARFLRGHPHEDAVCYEVFRRAVCDGDGICWEQLALIYRDQVRSWCRTARKSPAADYEELAAVAWERFWRSFTAERLAAASGTPAVLAYLRACAWSAAASSARAEGAVLSLDELLPAANGPARSIGELLRDSDPLPAEQAEAAEGRAELWRLVSSHLKNETEQILMHLTLEIGLKPREIQAQRPDCFADVKAVYTLTRNIYDRLGRSAELRRWYEERGR